MTFEIHQIRTKLCNINSIFQGRINEAASVLCIFHISAAATVTDGLQDIPLRETNVPKSSDKWPLYSDGTYGYVPGWYLRNSWMVAALDHLCFFALYEHEHSVYLHVNSTHSEGDSTAIHSNLQVCLQTLHSKKSNHISERCLLKIYDCTKRDGG